MKERPILFSEPMVRAILDLIKHMTRRTRGLEKINESPNDWSLVACKGGNSWLFKKNKNGTLRTVNCPYGAAGDRLWVKETFYNSRGDDSMPTYYKADQVNFGPSDWRYHNGPWKPSIFMPRWASRITLEVTRVRIERLQTITEKDSVAEGVTWPKHDDFEPVTVDDFASGPARIAFKELWSNINGAVSWYRNPWVWVVEFRRVEK